MRLLIPFPCSVCEIDDGRNCKNGQEPVIYCSFNDLCYLQQGDDEKQEDVTVDRNGFFSVHNSCLLTFFVVL